MGDMFTGDKTEKDNGLSALAKQADLLARLSSKRPSDAEPTEGRLNETLRPDAQQEKIYGSNKIATLKFWLSELKKVPLDNLEAFNGFHAKYHTLVERFGDESFFESLPREAKAMYEELTSLLNSIKKVYRENLLAAISGDVDHSHEPFNHVPF